MARSVAAQPAVFEAELTAQARHDYAIVKTRSTPELGAFFCHKHTLTGELDFVSRTAEEGFLKKGGLIYCIPLRELSWFSYGTQTGLLLYGGKVITGMISLDHDDDLFDEGLVHVGNFLLGTRSAMAFRPKAHDTHIVETEKVLSVGGLSASRVYLAKADSEEKPMNLSDEDTLLVMYYPNIFSGHAHMRDEQGKGHHAHWKDTIVA